MEHANTQILLFLYCYQTSVIIWSYLELLGGKNHMLYNYQSVENVISC